MTDQLDPPLVAAAPEGDLLAPPVQIVLVDPARALLDALVSAVSGTEDLACVGSGPTVQAIEPMSPADREPVVDAVVIHAATPGSDLAHEVATARRLHPDATIAVVAGYVDEYLVERLTATGATAVMSTDTPLADLFDVVRVGRPVEAGTWSASREGRAWDRAESHGITRRELDVLRHLADGLTPQQISRHLGVTIGTARDHLKQLRHKLDCRTAIELLVTAHRMGLLPNLDRPLP